MKKANKNIKILLVDDDDTFRTGCASFLSENGYFVLPAGSAEEGLSIIRKNDIQIAFVDYQMPGMNGMDFLKILKNENPNIDVVMITGYATIETAVQAIHCGAYEYLSKPFNPQKLIALVENILEKQRLISHTTADALNLEFEGKPLSILGKSSCMKAVFDLVLKVAPTDSTVLILGESGTGKELIAKAIHANSRRRKKAFFAIDCGSLVENLLESELFGHVKGSFTGAIATKHGAFELAKGGTFFLDEIGNISLNIQAKILRAVQERQIRRVGGNSTIHVDVRLVTATNIDLRKAVEDGKFREDLYYRLSVIPIHIPPLRERREDIPDLVDFIIKKQNQKTVKRPLEGISHRAMSLLKNFNWPGNIRELENVIERAAIIEESGRILESSLPAYIHNYGSEDKMQPLSLSMLEKEHIRKILTITARNISKSARILGIDRKTLYEKMKKYNL